MSVLNRFDLNLLTVFDAIYSNGGVTGAARQLHLSQPAISHSLAKLRKTFDDRLFVRHGNGLVPTARAHALSQPIREALGCVESALTDTAAFDPATSTRSFVLGLRPSSEMPGFAAFVARALSEAPGIALASRYLSRRSLAAALASGDLDLALDVEGPKAVGVRSVPLQSDPLLVAVRREHPLNGATLALESYIALDHVFVSPRPNGFGLEDAALARLGHVRRIKVRCQQALTAWQIVATSDMLCTLPQTYARALQKLLPNRLFPFPIAVGSNNLALYWHEASDSDPAATWLRDLARDHFGAPAPRPGGS